MPQLGFNDVWIGKIMLCVLSITFLALVNGEPKCLIKLSRGLRYGDPLSHYLFLLCTEGLIALLAKANAAKQVMGIQISREAHLINHLFFVISILLCKAKIKGNKNI